VCLYVRVYIRSLHSLVRTYKLYVTYSIGARPKNARLPLHDALACLSAHQTDHYHFTGRRRWRHWVATSTRAPALRAPRVPRTPCCYPAPYHAARHQLVSCSVKSVLGFRAVQLARRFTLLCSCLSSRLCAIAFFSYSYLRTYRYHLHYSKKKIQYFIIYATPPFTAFLCSVGYRFRIQYCTSGTWQKLVFWTDHDSTTCTTAVLLAKSSTS
jgi:hypothetical protein